MTDGVDTSSYQPLGTYDPRQFEIIHAEDWSLPDKVARNRDEHRPSAIYSWVYPGEPGARTVARALAALAKVGAVELGLWWDYEQDGVEQWQLDECFAACDAAGFWSGYYANMWRVEHRGLLDRPFWCAAYPWPNDGTFPGWDKLPAGRPINIWQYSSTNGTLDRDAIVDEAWYESLFTPTPAPLPPVPQIKEHDMYVAWGTDSAGTMFTEKIDGGISTLPFGGEVSPYGFYQDGWAYADQYKVPFVLMSPDEIAFARLRNYQVKNPPAGGPVPTLTVDSQVVSTVHAG